jgi:hypothetical protein
VASLAPVLHSDGGKQVTRSCITDGAIYTVNDATGVIKSELIPKAGLSIFG